MHTKRPSHLAFLGSISFTQKLQHTTMTVREHRKVVTSNTVRIREVLDPNFGRSSAILTFVGFITHFTISCDLKIRHSRFIYS